MTQPPAKKPRPVTAHAALEQADRHERFGWRELAVVLSHYELGVLEDVRVFPKGSRRAPKVKIVARSGEYLLKRRAVGGDDPFRVAFTHTLQLHLADRGFPVPRLLGTRDENNSMLSLEGSIYEMFEYVRGRRFDRSPEQAAAAGRAMGQLHRLLQDCRPSFDAPAGSFHGVEVDAHFARTPASISAVERDLDVAALTRTCERLRDAYRQADGRVRAAGFDAWTVTTIHGDWHPGNLLYRNGQVVAVLDFDSARIEPRLADVANGALQFAMRMREPTEPLTWPAGLDAHRLARFITGYENGSGTALRPEERGILPWLMIEALIIESLVPIATTGSFARIPGSTFLSMVERKVEWISQRADKLVRFVEESGHG
jgi:homoserine kinase type II